MNTSSKPRILIAGRNGSSNLCMARSLGQAGYRVEVLRITQKKQHFLNLMRFFNPERRSKYVQACHTCLCQNQNSLIAEALLSLAAPGEKTLLIPACDLAASAVDEYYDRLKPFYLLPSIGGQGGEINRLMDKGFQNQLAQEAGLAVVPSCVIRTSHGNFEIPKTLSYPCFLKPNVSKNSDKGKIRKCADETELRAALTAFSRNQDVEMLVEEFVDIHREYALLGLRTKHGTLCPGFFQLELGGHEERRGVTMLGRLLPSDSQQALMEQIVHFMDSLSYEGLFDVDLMEDQNGNIYFVELNLRYGASGYVLTEGGVNLPAMYADYMFAEKQPDLTCRVTRPGIWFVSEKILLDEYSRDFLTWSQVKELMGRADICFLKNDADPAPYRHFCKFYLFGFLTRILFRLKRRRKG